MRHQTPTVAPQLLTQVNQQMVISQICRAGGQWNHIELAGGRFAFSLVAKGYKGSCLVTFFAKWSCVSKAVQIDGWLLLANATSTALHTLYLVSCHHSPSQSLTLNYRRLV